MMVQGIAMSTFFVSMISIQFADLSPEQTPAASGLANFARITAGGFAASLTSVLWDRREVMHQTAIADALPGHVSGWDRAIALMQSAGLTSRQGLGALARQVENQSYTQAALDLFWLFGLLSMLMIPLIWLTRRAVSGSAPAAAD
jgi:DHA2 family multidrug resistance protein